MNSIKFEILPEYEILNSKENQLMHTLISIETPPIAEEKERLPIALVIVIDKSKSMHGEKLNSVIEASSSMVNWLTRRDSVGVVAYDTNVELVQPLTPLTDKFSITKKIQSITAGSSTNLSGGWLQALKMLRDHEEKSVKRVILLTDGIANAGIVNPSELKKIAKEHSDLGITTTTIGVGKDFSESLLKDIAISGLGRFYFIEGPEQSNEIFFKEFGNLTSLYGQGLEIKIKFNEGILFKELLSEVPYTYKDNLLILRPGDLRTDDTKNFILVTEINGALASKQNTLIEGEVSFYNIQKNTEYETFKMELKPKFDSNVDPEKHINKKVRLESLIAITSKAMIEASRLSAENDLSSAKDLIIRIEKRIEENFNLEPELLKLLLERLKDIQKNLEENIATASKKILAGAFEISDTFSYRENISRSKSSDKIYEISLEGQLDLYKCPELKSKIKSAIEEGFKFFICDMTNLNYIDSSGIGTLIQISNWVKNRNGLIVFTNVQGNVEKIFELTKLDDFFMIKDSLALGRIVIQEFLEKKEKN
ncbi:MAG: anti-sigma factor antagonist [Leptonema sp. (in: bacteria)]